MRMKQLLICAVLLTAAVCTTAQSVETARSYIYYQRYASAIEELKPMIDQNKNMPEAAYLLGEVYLKQQNQEAARDVLLKGTQYATVNNLSRKKEPLIFIGWAHYLLDKGETADARKQMEEILSLTKYKNTEILLAVANANIRSRNGWKRHKSGILRMQLYSQQWEMRTENWQMDRWPLPFISRLPCSILHGQTFIIKQALFIKHKKIQKPIQNNLKKQ
jgi:tetratricopeptide (TPR) repeat protein